MRPRGERIDVRLRLGPERVERVDILSDRTTTAAAVLEGKPVQDALGLLPLLFALCGVGQLTAGLRAVEAAMGIVVPPQERVARALLVAAETVSEHATRMLVDWPRLIGAEADIEGARRVREAAAALQRALYPDPRLRGRIGGGAGPVAAVAVASAAELAGAVADAVLGAPAGVMADAGDLADWIDGADTMPAQVLRAVLREGLADAGVSRVPLLPAIDPYRLAARLDRTDVAAFLRAPEWDGVVYETGPLARHGAQPAVAALRARHGDGVLARLAARVVETAVEARKIVRLAPTSCDTTATVEEPAGPAAGAGDAAVHWGLGVEEAARGRLFHHVVVAHGRVARWRILAPTEWNFHARGALAEGLRRLPVSDAARVRRAADWMVMALDPCVACAVRVEGPAHA
ncbi:nickel-dependent hydrogenase large subunit [Caenispirillum bisanense]|uniref:Coenzyme F420-reducing hydrogenase, alpha subunit n=1 Tax=Caenispirillum bisanense TaxID=414052 RepID=A0A286H0N8_9PROT|nr:nickel-dependent hydrogenase large subunit [Caenispirillum bisanense]SOE01311.1 Coenzyme F420-reducing hydrogenase, alpha subunit [Caenispirillum bisanense]